MTKLDFFSHRTNYTDKGRISFSELSDWSFCQYKHFLKHVRKIDIPDENANLVFGSCIHNTCEQYLKDKKSISNDKLKMDIESFETALKTEWAKKKLNESTDKRQSEVLDSWLEEGKKILAEIPKFVDEQFPEWNLIEAEEEVYIDIQFMNMNFKGKIDVVLQNGEDIWILDWKTSNTGWKSYQKNDFMKKAQLTLYKKFWAKKHDIPEANIRTGFVILSRNPELKNKRIEFVEVETTDMMTKNIVLVMKNAIRSADMGIALKTGKIGYAYGKPKNNCKFCVYNQTDYCEGLNNEQNLQVRDSSILSDIYQKYQLSGTKTKDVPFDKILLSD